MAHQGPRHTADSREFLVLEQDENTSTDADIDFDVAADADAHAYGISKRKRQQSDDSFILCAVAAALALSCVLTTETIKTSSRVSLAGWVLPEVCAFKRMTSVPCPGCGLTRSFIRLAHGDWSGSVRFHRLGWLIFGLAIAQIPYRLLRIAGRVRPHPRMALPLIAIVTGLLVANWVYMLIEQFINLI